MRDLIFDLVGVLSMLVLWIIGCGIWVLVTR